jgi:hypothetical protein
MPNVMPETWDECYEELITTVVRLHLLSRPLARLPPFRRLTPHLLMGEGTRPVGPGLEEAIDFWEDDGDPEPLVKAYVSFMALPGHVLVTASNLVPASGEVTIEHPECRRRANEAIEIGNETEVARKSRKPKHGAPKRTQASGGPLAKRAATLVRRDRKKTATKVLTGNGVAAKTEAVADLMQGMQLDYGEIIRLPEVRGPQIVLSPLACEEEPRKKPHTPSSIGVPTSRANWRLMDTKFPIYFPGRIGG